MITGTENIQTIATHFPMVIHEFEKIGLGNYFGAENLKKIGRFTILNTLLKSTGIDSIDFINSLNQLIDNEQSELQIASVEKQQQLHFMAMLPCGLRNPFKEFFEAHVLNNQEYYKDLNYLTEGNVNHELSYYPLLDSIESEDELPDIIMASDVNNFFHRHFIEKFLNKGIFSVYSPYEPNFYLEKAGYTDPDNNYTMFTANMLVMVVDKNRLGNKNMPLRWEDILSKDFENEIIMRGEDDFFCNAVLLPFYKDHGFSAIEEMARNIKSGKHPAEMVKLAGSGKPDAATIYIMPYFFAKRIKSEKVEIVWPADGAIASPVFMLVKKSATEKHQRILDFLVSKETGAMLKERLFPTLHHEIDHSDFPQQVKWLGWDFLKNNDIGKLKDSIREVFMNIWQHKTESHEQN